ncbi:hypothetical protein ACFQX4_22845 [Roseomonas sp. GCM10028921]
MGRVHAGPVDINAEMVRRGMAWVYRRYSQDLVLLRLRRRPGEHRAGCGRCPTRKGHHPGNGGGRGGSESAYPPGANCPPPGCRSDATAELRSGQACPAWPDARRSYLRGLMRLIAYAFGAFFTRAVAGHLPP